MTIDKAGNTIKDTDKAYIAGFLDADGSIGLYQQSSGGSVICRVTIYSQDEALLGWIQGLYGGTVALGGIYGKVVSGTFYWLAAGTCDIVEFLNDIIPYMQLKTDQAQLALEYKNWQSEALPGVGHRGPEAIERKAQFVSRSKYLNARTSAAFRKYREEANAKR